MDSLRNPHGIQGAAMLHELRIGGHILKVTPVYDTYWRFAALRQQLFMRRVRATPQPWTNDPILVQHRFTNVYRASDRVSQYLIREVIYTGAQTPDEVFFRTLLFKLFNRIDTWERLQERFGPIAWESFNFERYSAALDELMAAGKRLYSAAYIMPAPAFGNQRKHRNHLRLLEHMMRDGAPRKVAAAKSLENVFNILRGYPSLGDFLAFQFCIDLNYSEVVNFSEMDFVVAGPGARDGISKCFASTDGLSEEQVIRLMAERAPEEFARLHLSFETLWGRALQLIDCQNVFCEVSKYARVAHPEVSGISGRTRIKQKFVAKRDPLLQQYPPKWGLSPTVEVLCEPGANSVRGRDTGSQQVQTSFSL
jgi:hypothetical protein